jgi:hypothetical protein
MKRPLKWGVRCGFFGFAIAASLAALAYGLNAAHARYHLEALYVILWPASLGLMATENATTLSQVITVVMLAAINAATYFVIGLLAGSLPKSKGPNADAEY